MTALCGGARWESNTSPGPELLRYDHFGHALAIFVGALLVWELLVRDAFVVTGRGSLVAVTTLAALGLGAINEAVEFVATLTHGTSQRSVVALTAAAVLLGVTVVLTAELTHGYDHRYDTVSRLASPG